MKLSKIICGVTVLVALTLAGWLLRPAQPSSGESVPAGSSPIVSASPTAPALGRASSRPGSVDLNSSSVLAEAGRLAAMPESLSRQAAITAFIATLTDPRDCAALATNLPLYGHALTGAALRRWVELDAPGSIYDYAMATPQRELRVANLEWMFRDYAEQNPTAALAYAKSLPGVSETERNNSVAATLAALAKTDPETATSELRRLPASVAAGPASEIYSELARVRPPSDVFAEAGGLPGAARSAAQQAVLKVVASSDPQAAVNLWHGTDNAALRHDLTRALADGFRDAGADPKAMAEWLFQNAPERGAESVRAEALSRLAEVDPAGAKSLLTQRPIGERDDLNAALASMLSPEAGLEFARQISREDQRQTALAEVASRLASSDPARLYAESSRDANFARAALPAVVDALAYGEVSAATSYVQSLPEALRNEAAPRLVERLVDIAPEKAVAAAADLITDPDARRLNVASAYAASIITRNAQELQQLPSIPAGLNRDEVLAAVVPLIAFRNPDAAWAVARSIGDESLRVNALQEAVQGVAQVVSLDAAERRLAEAALDANVAQQIRSQLPVRRSQQ